MTTRGEVQTTRSGEGDSAPSMAYVKAIDEQLARLLREHRGAVFSDDIFSRMRGAFPTLVFERLRQFGCENFVVHRPRPTQSTSRDYSPELHALDFEWYFTDDSVDRLIELACRPGRLAICLGVPTVAAAALRKDANVVLVERNPLVVQRFPALLRTSRLWLMDVADSLQHLPEADAVVFDAPWYPADISAWLAIAASAVTEGGLIIFSLFPDLVRPTARIERDAILETTRRIGRTEVFEDALRYETPAFESEALKASGISDLGSWRQADLVVVQKRGNVAPAVVQPHSPQDVWLTYLIQPRVVKVRRCRRPANVEPLLAPIPGIRGFAYPSVSMLDSLRAVIDIWTSRNKVARTGNQRLLSAILADLEHGTAVRRAVSRHTQASSDTEATELEQHLTQLLA